MLKNKFSLPSFKIPKILGNFYLVISGLFFLWMLLFDTNDLISQYRSWSKLKGVSDEKKYYQSKITEVKKQRNELFGDKKALEKYAREQYLMKKPSEEVYLVVEED
jgi:cell division protein DivIC